jgi:hypothetical protein
MLQLREGGPLHQVLPPAQVRQLTTSLSTRRELVEGPSTAVRPRQLHHHGGDTLREVLVGTLFLNERPIIMLFDSGASHDFMSSTCAKKAKLIVVASGALYVISIPEGQVDVDPIA